MISARFERLKLISAVAACLLICGCGNTEPQRQPISGAVALDGRPVNGATIIFTPVGEGLSAAATIVDGKFSLTDLDGPTIGEFDVRINPIDAEMEQVEADPTVLADANRKPSIPRVYQTHGKLKASISDQPNQSLDFALLSKP